MNGTRLADRYELLEEGPRALGGRLFRAKDLSFGEIVAVKMIGGGSGAEPGTDELQAELQKLQRDLHPAILRYHGIQPGQAFLVREWIHGFSLLELLKRRHELSAGETLQLLEPLASALDFIAERRLSLPAQLLSKLLIQFDPAVLPESIIGEPMGAWPPFALKLNPLSVRALLLEADGQTTLTTVTDLRTLVPEARLNAPLRLAELLYEVLGGHVRIGRERRYTPLPALREEGNGVLRRALLEDFYTDAASLWAALRAAEPSEFTQRTPLASHSPQAPVRWKIPASLLEPCQSAKVLRLVPADPETPAVHLVARSTFTLGRSFAHADFVARFYPETPANEDLTNQISRVHVTAEVSGESLTIRDGHHDSASVNGTQMDDRPLPSSPATPLERAVQLSLGGVYSVEIVPLLTPEPPTIEIENLPAVLPAEETPRHLHGAVFFLPARGQPALRHAVWIFSDAGFSLGSGQRFVWDTRGGGRSPATFHYLHSGFWLSNRGLASGVLRLEGTPLEPNEIAPLLEGQTLQIGPTIFTLELT
jgi:hypothetical protein